MNVYMNDRVKWCTHVHATSQHQRFIMHIKSLIPHAEFISCSYLFSTLPDMSNTCSINVVGLFGKGYNITVDNFFTSPNLETILWKRKTTVVGTVRPNRKGFPNTLYDKQLYRYESSFFWDSMNEQLLVRYQAKQKKSVILLSTLHRIPSIEPNNRQKPTIITFYNENKCGVDIVGNMLHKYSTRCSSRRWTMAVWENILDIAALNAWICYKEATQVKISRKDFILNLINELRYRYVQRSATFSNISRWKIPDAPKRAECISRNCRNRSRTFCLLCRQEFCGSCCSDTHAKIRFSLCRSCDI